MIFLQHITLTMLIGIMIVCSGCGKAIATDAENEKQNRLETITRSDCLAKTNKDDKLLCLKRLAAQNKRELSSLDNQIETGEARNEKLRQENEAMLEQLEEGVLDSRKPD